MPRAAATTGCPAAAATTGSGAATATTGLTAASARTCSSAAPATTVFVFNERLGVGLSRGFDDPLGHSRIVDFTVGVDKIVLADTIFDSLAHIAYDPDTGALPFDPAPPAAATPSSSPRSAKNLAITDADFVLV